MKAGDIGTVWCGEINDHHIWHVPGVTGPFYQCAGCTASWPIPCPIPVGSIGYSGNHSPLMCSGQAKILLRTMCGILRHQFVATSGYNGQRCGACSLEVVDGTGVPDHPCGFSPLVWTAPAQPTPSAATPSWSLTGPTNSAYVTPAKTVSWRPVRQAYATPIDLGTPAYIVKTQRLCECGSHVSGAKDYGPGHSSWCPAREPDGT